VIIARVVAVLVAAAVLLTAGWLLWLKTAAPSAGLQARLHTLGDRPCAALEVVGLRGHGDPPTDVGPDVRALIQVLQPRLGTSRLDAFALPYEQGSDLGIIPLPVPRDVRTGAAALADYVDVRATRCPGEPRVVVGQSEGAAAAHLAFPRIAHQVAATVLLGDPLHLSSAVYDENLGPAPNGVLVPWVGLGIDLSRLTWTDPVPRALASKVRSYCLPHDHVCGLDVFDRHPDAHLDYRRNPVVSGSGTRLLDLAVDFILASVGTGH